MKKKGIGKLNENALWKYHTLRRSYAVRRWNSYIIHLYKVASESSYNFIYDFLTCLCISNYIETDSCVTLSVAWKTTTTTTTKTRNKKKTKNKKQKQKQKKIYQREFF